MKLSCVVVAIAFTSAAAFAPAKVERAATALNMDRRAVFGQVAATAAVLASAPAISFADGAVSTATIQKARTIYGDRIVELKSAVEAGDFAAVAEEKNAFILFNSGAYPKNKQKKAVAIDGTNKIFAAIRSQDKDALKTAYKSYVAENSITGFPEVDVNKGQSYSNDMDYRKKSKAG